MAHKRDPAGRLDRVCDLEEREREEKIRREEMSGATSMRGEIGEGGR